MVSVIQYGENIPPELLDVLLINITPSQKVCVCVCVFVSVEVFACFFLPEGGANMHHMHLHSL